MTKIEMEKCMLCQRTKKARRRISERADAPSFRLNLRGLLCALPLEVSCL